jgi:hypothetical protein
MKKLILVLTLILIWPSITLAQNAPCSGKKGGISHCEGIKYICNDGSTSRSKKHCSSEYSGEKNTRMQTSAIADKPITETSEKTEIT